LALSASCPYARLSRSMVSSPHADRRCVDMQGDDIAVEVKFSRSEYASGCIIDAQSIGDLCRSILDTLDAR
jgi:hypothetical protein